MKVITQRRSRKCTQLPVVHDSVSYWCAQSTKSASTLCATTSNRPMSPLAVLRPLSQVVPPPRERGVYGQALVHSYNCVSALIDK